MNIFQNSSCKIWSDVQIFMSKHEFQYFYIIQYKINILHFDYKKEVVSSALSQKKLCKFKSKKKGLPCSSSHKNSDENKFFQIYSRASKLLPGIFAGWLSTVLFPLRVTYLKVSKHNIYVALKLGINTHT